MSRYFTLLKGAGSYALSTPVTPARIKMWVSSTTADNKTGLPAGTYTYTANNITMVDFAYAGGPISEIGNGFDGIIAKLRFYDETDTLTHWWDLDGDDSWTAEVDAVSGVTLTRTGGEAINFSDLADEIDSVDIDLFTGSNPITLDGSEGYGNLWSRSNPYYQFIPIRIASTSNITGASNAIRWVAGTNVQYCAGTTVIDWRTLPSNGSLSIMVFSPPASGTVSDIAITISIRVDATAQADTDTAPVGGNTPPVVSAGSDVTVNPGDTGVALTGTATDDDTVSSVLWTQLSGTAVTINNANTLNANYDAPAESEGEELVFRLTASDNNGASASADVTHTLTQNIVTQVTVHWFGDSIANHLGGGATGNLVSAFAAHGVTATSVNAGVGGDFSERMLARIDTVLGNARPGNNLFICVLGTNSESDADYLVNMRQIIERIHAAGHQVAIATKTISAQEESSGTEYGASIRNSNMCAELLPLWYDSEAGRAVMDYWTFTNGGHAADPTWFIDNYHPSGEGENQIYQYTADTVAPLLSQLFLNSAPQVTLTTPVNNQLGIAYTPSVSASDSDVGTLSYQWYADYDLLEGEAGTTLSRTENETGSRLITVAVSDGVTTTLKTNAVEVIENTGLSVTVTAPSSVNAGASFTLAASATDNDGNAMSYTWREVDTSLVTLGDAYAASTTQNAPAQASTLVFEVSVSNGFAVVTEQVTISVEVQDIASNFTATFTGLADGTHDTRVIDVDNEALIFFGQKAYASGATEFTFDDVPVGTNIEVSVLLTDDGGLLRGVTI